MNGTRRLSRRRCTVVVYATTYLVERKSSERRRRRRRHMLRPPSSTQSSTSQTRVKMNRWEMYTGILSVGRETEEREERYYIPTHYTTQVASHSFSFSSVSLSFRRCKTLKHSSASDTFRSLLLLRVSHRRRGRRRATPWLYLQIHNTKSDTYNLVLPTTAIDSNCSSKHKPNLHLVKSANKFIFRTRIINTISRGNTKINK